MKTKAKIGGSPGATKSWERQEGCSPRDVGGDTALPTPGFWTSGFENCERINLCCFKLPICGDRLWQPQEANRIGHRILTHQLCLKSSLETWVLVYASPGFSPKKAHPPFFM